MFIEMKISIIMPVYNAKKHLESAICSILEQSFKDFEFIIINDSSTDGSRAIIARFADKDSRIRIIDNELNLGVAESLNQALRIAQGEYIARQDADDVSMPDRLEKQHTFLAENHDVNICATYAWITDEEGIPVYSFSYPTVGSEIKECLENGINPIIHGSVMFRKSVLDALCEPYFRFTSGQDLDLWLRLSHTATFAIIPAILYRYRRADSSVSGKFREIRIKLQQLKLTLHNERKISGKEITNWGKSEEELLTSLPVASLTATSKANSNYTRGYLSLLSGRQAKTLKIFFTSFHSHHLPLIILALLPFAGYRIARKIHLELSPWDDVEWK